MLISLLATTVLAAPIALTALAALAVGVAGGIALAWWGLRLTKFEKTARAIFIRLLHTLVSHFQSCLWRALAIVFFRWQRYQEPIACMPPRNLGAAF